MEAVLQSMSRTVLQSMSETSSLPLKYRVHVHVGLFELHRSETESLYVKISQCNIPCLLGVFNRPPNQSAVNRDIGLTLDVLRIQFDYLCVGSKLPFFIR